MDSILLTLLTFLPIVGGLVIMLAPQGLARMGAFAISVLTFLLSLPLWTGFDRSAAGVQFEQVIPWIPEFGVHYRVGVDGLSVLLVLLTTFLMPWVILGSFTYIQKHIRAYMGLMLLLQGAMTGAFVALDIFLFYVYWELMLIPIYLIVGIWGGTNRIYAAVKLFVFTMTGSLLMLGAILALYFAYHEQTGTYSAYLHDLYATNLPIEAQSWMFLCFAVAFAIKMPMWPLHTWLPDAHTEAPTGGSMVLAGILLKMGTYGFVRLAMPLFPEAAFKYAPMIAVLSIAGIIIGALVAMVQTDIKKLVAYSSVSHLGFVSLGLFTFNVQGTKGAMMQMVNHGLSTPALFLIVGILYERRHTRAIKDYGGIAKVVPLMTFFFMFFTFSSIGLPGLNGFIGEFLVLLGTFAWNPLYSFLAGTAVIFGAAYMLWMFQRVMFGPLKHKANEAIADLTPRELATVIPLAAACLFLGVYPAPFLDTMSTSVNTYVKSFRTRVDLPAAGSGLARLSTEEGPEGAAVQVQLAATDPSAPSATLALSDAESNIEPLEEGRQ